MKPIILASAAALAVLASPAFAATQGTPGPTSTGTVTTNASITPEVNITNLNDFTFDATKLQNSLNTGIAAGLSDFTCVWSNNVDGSYFITVTGDGAGNAFTITNGTDAVGYTASFFSTAQGTGSVLTSGAKSAQFKSNATVPDCGGGTTALIAVSIANSDIARMNAGTTYTGVLTLLVTPT